MGISRMAGGSLTDHGKGPGGYDREREILARVGEEASRLAAFVGSSYRGGSVFRKSSLSARIRIFLERLRRGGKVSLDRGSRKRLHVVHRSLPARVQAGGR